VGRLPDVERRQFLLDGVVSYLAEHGLADVSLRPVARSLGVSVNGLVHHLGTREDMVVAALQRTVEMQEALQAGWLRRQPTLTMTGLLRRWWRWINASPANLALVRLGIEAAALDATVSGLPGDVRADQIGVWRANIEQRLVAEGMDAATARVEASILKATFTGLVVDLLATGDRRRLTEALDAALNDVDGRRSRRARGEAVSRR
jgi:AcrR family transcriptional regulator